MTDSLSLLGPPNIWDFVQTGLNKVIALYAFQPEIKKWLPPNCSWKLYFTHLPNFDFT